MRYFQYGTVGKTFYPVDDFIRYEVFSRDKFTCRNCGFKSYWRSKKLHCHHLDLDGQKENANNSLENLITLCDKCHGTLHVGNLKKKVLE